MTDISQMLWVDISLLSSPQCDVSDLDNSPPHGLWLVPLLLVMVLPKHELTLIAFDCLFVRSAACWKSSLRSTIPSLHRKAIEFNRTKVPKIDRTEWRFPTSFYGMSCRTTVRHLLV